MTRRRFLLALGTGMLSLAALAVGVLGGRVASARANLVGDVHAGALVPAGDGGATVQVGSADSSCCEACPDCCPPGDVCPACASTPAEAAASRTAKVSCCPVTAAKPAAAAGP